MKTHQAIRHLSPSMIVATVALFVALGGTSYAALVITGANISNGTIRSIDIANGAHGVQGRDVKDRSLTLSDISPAARVKLKGAKGDPGAPGAGLTPVTFTPPTLQNGWATVALTVPGFGKDDAGFVHLRGQISSGTLGTAAFQLPAGQRPTQTSLFGALHIFGGNSTTCIVAISTSGDVIIGTVGLPVDSGCAETAGIYSLDGITFGAG